MIVKYEMLKDFDALELADFYLVVQEIHLDHVIVDNVEWLRLWSRNKKRLLNINSKKRGGCKKCGR